MLSLSVDPHGSTPVYRQIMDQIKFSVASGALKPGAQLPSIRELAKALAVNPTTIVKAYGELEHEGLAEIRHGKGAFIAEGERQLGMREREAMLRRLLAPLAVEARQLRVPAETAARLLSDEIERLGKGQDP